MSASSITPDTTISASAEQVSSSVADEEVILNLKNGSYYGLDPIGAHIWQLIQEPITVEVLIDQLLKAYDVDRERCQRDVMALLEDLQDNELLNIHAAERP